MDGKWVELGSVAGVTSETQQLPQLPIHSVAGYLNSIGSPGVSLIAMERQRQIEKESFTVEHDDMHPDGDLEHAAACYIQANEYTDPALAPLNGDLWPWEGKWWKPSSDPIRNLVKAGALIAAEIDRIQRVAAK